MRKISKIVIACFIAILSGCSSTDQNQTPDDSKTSGVGEEVHFPLQIEDQMGRTITLDEEPQRVITTYYISTTTAIGVGGQEKLVGIEGKAKKRSIYQFAAPELMELPSVGSLKEFNLEACLELKPDLVILNIKQKDFIEPLEAAGISVLVVNPESDDQLMEMISLFGQVFNQPQQSNELIAFMEDTQKELDEKLSNVDVKTVYFGGNSNFLSTAGNQMFQSALIEGAHGKNVANEIEDTYWANVSYEDIINWNPEVMILASASSYDIDSILNEPSLASLPAIQNKEVYELPNEIESWDSPIPSSILGKVYLASKLYPKEVSKEYYVSKVEDFYQQFYGFQAEVNE